MNGKKMWVSLACAAAFSLAVFCVLRLSEISLAFHPQTSVKTSFRADSLGELADASELIVTANVRGDAESIEYGGAAFVTTKLSIESVIRATGQPAAR